MRTLSKKGVHPLNQFEKVLKVNFSFSPFLLSKYKDVLYKLSSWVYIDAVYLVSFMTRHGRFNRAGSLKLLASSNLMGTGDEAQERLPDMGGLAI